MNHVALNHALSSNKVNVLATTLLVFGGVFSITLLLYSHQLSSRANLLQHGLQQQSFLAHKSNFTRPLLRSKTKVVAVKDDETSALNVAIQEIVLPWSALFKSLESANNPEIKLLALEPNPKQRTLHITAVALNYESMLRYVDALAQQNTLKDVVLQSQESTDMDGQKVVRFEIGAVWKT
jgi:Tfp pilus assembly protein PilN